MIDFLVFIKIFVLVILIALATPQDIPIMPLCLLESINLEHRPEQLGLAFDQLEEHFVVLVGDQRIENGTLLKEYRTLSISH